MTIQGRAQAYIGKYKKKEKSKSAIMQIGLGNSKKSVLEAAERREVILFPLLLCPTSHLDQKNFSSPPNFCLGGLQDASGFH